MTPLPITHAGAIALRRHHGRTQVLLVNAKRTTSRIFPKGHIAKGETEEAAALRELREEAAIEGRILEPAGTVSFELGPEMVTVRYLLVLATGKSPKKLEKKERKRDPIWVEPRAAVTLLHFKNTRDLLSKVLPRIDKIARRGPPVPPGYDELLRAEFAQVGQSLLANEEQGEKRVTFFITLVTAAAGALGFFGDKMEFRPQWRMLAGAVLVALFFFGIQTLLRVIERNSLSDGLKLRLDRIRRYFAPSRVHHGFLAFDPNFPKPREFKSWPLMGSGGWLDTVVLADAVLLTGLSGLVVWDCQPGYQVGVITGTFVAAWLGIHLLGNRLHRNRWEKEAQRL